MASDLIRSPTVRLLHARQDHAICLRLAASYRHRIAAGETAERADNVCALSNDGGGSLAAA
ncbi:hypothetical protein MKK64_08525 [Methylobacterium sp. E-025]|uniref:hypothetical protein n=1 Tax=Methylobacterium sp. E-025 TaxID=2836561 RepID=UPI001FB92EB1|nr:hypothetical protein [Methylobacterium sp. E-025]MCJ2111233.1 hypothetical protein [Methylobacterium sp. E-025]